jgi:hypothetical protein
MKRIDMSNIPLAVQPTCANTLLSKHLPALETRQTFFETVVLPSGYPFFEWNSRIYQVIGKQFDDTRMVLDDITPPLREGLMELVETQCQNWDGVKAIISDLNEHGHRKFGPDYSDRDE